METTEVSPRELRDIEITERLRGYDRDEVDELLERAALTVESYSEKINDLTSRLEALTQGGQITPNFSQDLIATSAEPAAPIASPTVSDDLIQRTLILAQKTADETIKQAEAEAERIVTHARKKSEEITTREKDKLIKDLNDLDSQRNALKQDIESLKQFDNYHRAKVRALIEEDLQKIEDRKAADVFDIPQLPSDQQNLKSNTENNEESENSGSTGGMPQVQTQPIQNEIILPPMPEQPAVQQPVAQPVFDATPSAPQVVVQEPQVAPIPEQQLIPQQQFPTENIQQQVPSQPTAVAQPEQVEPVVENAQAPTQVPGDVWQAMPSADDDFFASLRDAVSDNNQQN